MIEKMKTLIPALAVLLVAGCMTIPSSGTGGSGSFQSRLPLDGLAIQFAEACQRLGYETEIETTSPASRSVVLEYPSRTGTIIIARPDESNPNFIRYRYSLTHGVLDHHEERQQEKLRRAIQETIEKWGS